MIVVYLDYYNACSAKYGIQLGHVVECFDFFLSYQKSSRQPRHAYILRRATSTRP